MKRQLKLKVLAMLLFSVMTIGLLSTSVSANTYSDWKVLDYKLNASGYLSEVTFSVYINNEHTGSLPLALGLTSGPMQNAGSTDAYTLYYPNRSQLGKADTTGTELQSYIDAGNLGGLTAFQIVAPGGGVREFTFTNMDQYNIDIENTTFHLGVWVIFYSPQTGPNNATDWYWMPDGNTGNKGCPLNDILAEASKKTVTVSNNTQNYEMISDASLMSQVIIGKPIEPIVFKAKAGYYFTEAPIFDNGLLAELKSDGTMVISGTPTQDVTIDLTTYVQKKAEVPATTPEVKTEVPATKTKTPTSPQTGDTLKDNLGYVAFTMLVSGALIYIFSKKRAHN